MIRESIVITQVKGSASIKSNLGDLPPISCFRTRMGQVVTNLISNAMDVLAAQPTKQGHGSHHGKIEITSELVERDGKSGLLIKLQPVLAVLC